MQKKTQNLVEKLQEVQKVSRNQILPRFFSFFFYAEAIFFLERILVAACRIIVPARSKSFLEWMMVTVTFKPGIQWVLRSALAFMRVASLSGIALIRVMRIPFAPTCLPVRIHIKRAKPRDY